MPAGVRLNPPAKAGPGLSQWCLKLRVEGFMAAASGQVVCFEAFRKAREQRQARVLPYLLPQEGRAPRSPFGAGSLSSRELAHRRRMLQHLTEEPLEGALST